MMRKIRYIGLVYRGVYIRKRKVHINLFTRGDRNRNLMRALYLNKKLSAAMVCAVALNTRIQPRP